MKIILAAHVIGCIDSRTGGPAQSVEQLCFHLKEHAVKTDIFSFHYPYDDRCIAWDSLQVHHLNYNSAGRFLAGWNPRAFRQLLELIQKEKVQLIHNQGLWLFVNQYARQAAQKLNLPLVTSVRGMLEPWTMKQNVFKKKFAWLLYEKKNLSMTQVFHATSDQEAEAIRGAGFHQPIAIIPNGVNMPAGGRSPASGFLYEKFGSERVLLFLSRIDPKKGLERLLSIWARLSLLYPQWKLVIAGDGSSLYIKKLKQKILEYNLEKRTSWVGFVEGENKKDLWTRAELFVLPSFSENFGNVVAEALSYEVPVITTEGTPWKELQDYNCGWWVSNSEASIEKSLNQAMSLAPEELKMMGKKGKLLIQEKYIWNDVARKMAQVYRWILKTDKKPDCVRLD